MKNAIRNDVENFYDSRATYEKLKVPWKRGIIYYGAFPGLIAMAPMTSLLTYWPRSSRKWQDHQRQGNHEHSIQPRRRGSYTLR